MEFDSIPWRVRRFLRVVDEHWISTEAPGRVLIGGKRGEPKRNLRVWLWLAAGLERVSRRHIRPTCGAPWCCNPEHCGYPRRTKRYDRASAPGRGTVRITDEYERGVFVAAMERRGFVRHVGNGALRVGEYRIHQRSPVVTWQEPARGWYPRASEMAERIARARARRSAQRRAAA